MDLDNNNYPDLLVGAYESNNAVYLKSAPVVHLDSEVQFLVSGKQINIGKIISNFHICNCKEYIAVDKSPLISKFEKKIVFHISDCDS